MTNDTNLRELTAEEIEGVVGGSKIQEAMQTLQTWFTCLKSIADSKGQVQQELARFR